MTFFDELPEERRSYGFSIAGEDSLAAWVDNRVTAILDVADWVDGVSDELPDIQLPDDIRIPILVGAGLAKLTEVAWRTRQAAYHASQQRLFMTHARVTTRDGRSIYRPDPYAVKRMNHPSMRPIGRAGVQGRLPLDD